MLRLSAGFKKFPEDRTPAGLNVKRSAHTGDIFGAPTQALYFIVGLGIAVQAITGAMIWWNARGRISS